MIFYVKSLKFQTAYTEKKVKDKEKNWTLYYSAGESRHCIIIPISISHYRIQFKCTVECDMYISIINISASAPLTDHDKAVLYDRLKKFIIVLGHRLKTITICTEIEEILFLDDSNLSHIKQVFYDIHDKKVKVSLAVNFNMEFLDVFDTFRGSFVHEHLIHYFDILVEAENKNPFYQFLKWWLKKNTKYIEP